MEAAVGTDTTCPLSMTRGRWNSGESGIVQGCISKTLQSIREFPLPANLCHGRQRYLRSGNCTLGQLEYTCINVSILIHFVFFTVWRGFMILLHGIIKKSQKTPKTDLDLAKKRRNDVLKGGTDDEK
jgi:hypothetical protein